MNYNDKLQNNYIDENDSKNDYKNDYKNEFIDIKYRMPVKTKIFFKKLENYLDNEINYFGSIRRWDYLPNSSDIDAVIFVNDEKSIINKIQNYLNLPNYSFNKIYNFIPLCNKVVTGYKYVIKDKPNNFKADLLIYNKKYEDCVTKDATQISNMPFLFSIIFYLLKKLFNYNLLPKEMFLYIKRLLFSYIRDGSNFLNTRSSFWKFVELKQSIK